MATRNFISRLNYIPNFLSLFQGWSWRRMNEVELGTHTIKSHGAILARNHMQDWLILLLLVVIEAVLNVIHPFYRFVGKDMMSDLKYPLKDNTVPTWAVPVGLLFSVVITGIITDAIKTATGRPRPDFFWRCFPDGKDIYDRLGDVVCHGKPSDIKEGHKSFPSGHASWSFAGLGYLSLYLSGKIQAFDGKGHVAKLCIVFFPLLAASLVAISRVDDYWHHWQDVFAGAIIGLLVSSLCYSQFFPAPYLEEGWGPYAYFRALEETRSDTNGGGQPVNAMVTVPTRNLVVVNQPQLTQNGDELEELESGIIRI